jgi:polyhydroxyalkanoate synthesis regulator phasin
MHAVLMETPEHEYAYGVADKEEARKTVEDVIRRSGDPTGQVENAYVPAIKSTIEHSG